MATRLLILVQVRLALGLFSKICFCWASLNLIVSLLVRVVTGTRGLIASNISLVANRIRGAIISKVIRLVSMVSTGGIVSKRVLTCW